MQVFRLDCMIPPMHLFWLVTHDLHGGHRFHSRPSQVRARGLVPIMKPETGNTCPTTGRRKGSTWILPRLPHLQEHPLGV